MHAHFRIAEQVFDVVEGAKNGKRENKQPGDQYKYLFPGHALLSIY